MSTERPGHDEADDGARDETARETVGRDGRAQDGARQDDTAPGTDTGTDPDTGTGADTDKYGTAPGTGGHHATPETHEDGAARETHEDGAAAGEPAAARHRSPLVVASVALAVLLVGGGGAYLATTASDGQDGSGTAASGDVGNPPPLVLDDFPQGGGGSGDSGGNPGIAPGEPDPNGSVRTVYRADRALPDGPSSASVYRTTGSVTAEQVSQLAKALGVSGTPRLSGGSWQVGPEGDGSGPSLRVVRQAPGSWTFARNVPHGDDCGRGGECAGSVSGGPAGRPVSEQAAKAAAAPVLKALGQDDAKLDAGQLRGAVRVVNAEPKLGGTATFGWSTGVRIGSDGSVVGGDGRLLTPVKGETYPVLGAEETLQQLNRSGYGRMRPKPCPVAAPDTARGSGPYDPDRAVCARPGSAPKDRNTVVPVHGATFGLATHLVAGHPALVPSWLFEARPKGADSGYTVSYPAVDPKYLSGRDTGRDGHDSPAPSTPSDGRHVHVSSYTADDRSLTVHFYGGVCSTYTVAADESADKVTVTVTRHEKQPGRVCIMIAKEITKTVQLDEPLGDRKVVDSTGATIRQD